MSEDDPLALSALQHWAYCPRLCGLIHLEQAFDDNVHTQRGHAVHAQVDAPGVEERHGLRVERALPPWSDRPGLIGKADGRADLDGNGVLAWVDAASPPPHARPGLGGQPGSIQWRHGQARGG